MSFLEGIVCPQALQTCCDTPPSFGKDIPRLNFLFAFAEVMAAVRDSVIGRRSSGVHLRIQTFRPGEMSGRPVVARLPSRKCCRQLWCGAFPNCYTH